MEQKQSAPAVKSTAVFGDYLIMLIVPAVISIWYYGTAAVHTLIICAASSILLDFVFSVLFNKQYYAADLSGLCTGLMIAMMMPAAVPAYVCVLACAFAILVIKIPFGGGMRAPFVPAAAGFASAAVCFKDLVFTYSGGREFMGSASLGSILQAGGSVRITSASFLDIFTGNIYGPMGTGCAAVFLGCICFLLIRRREALISSAAFLGAVVIFSLVLPRTGGTALSSLLLELSSGSLLFAAVFFLTDYSTLPGHTLNRIVYGLFTGIICMVMRRRGIYEEPVCFAVILGNAFSPLLDNVTDRLQVIFTSGKSKKEAYDR